jgi:deoxyribonuclease V
MEIPSIAPWPSTTSQAKVLQETLRHQVIRVDRLDPVQFVAGVDVGFEEKGAVTRAAVVVLSFPELQWVEQAISRQKTCFPYIPGFLSFREIPGVLAALAQLKTTPQLLLCDGQGIAHPRRFGLAAHLGVLVDLPAIGVAKSRFIGTHDPVPEERGAWVPLWDQEARIGAVLRSRTKTKPLYVSIGHRISLETAVTYVMACTPKYRLPETTRWADKLASQKN